MTRFDRVRVIAAVLVFFVPLMSCSKNELCDKRVKDKCLGCSPILEQNQVAFKALDKTLLTEVKRCLDASTDASVKSVEYVKGTLKGCISTNKTIDDKSRDELIKLIDRTSVPDKEYDAWLSCKIESTPRVRPLVVLMDSHVPDTVYCKHTREIAGSNSDDIINLIKDLPISIGTASTNLEWKNEQQVIDMKPSVVVVHASAFYDETQPMEGNQKLVNFLNSMKGTSTKILVYTRGLPDQPSNDVHERWKKLTSAVGGNVELFVMPKGHASCFDDPEVAVPFKNKIKDVLAMKEPEAVGR